jgi:hypothetical protein
VVGILLVATGLAWEQVSAQGLRAAVDDIIHGAAMAGQEVLAEPFPILPAIALQDVRHLWHAHAPTC